MSEHLCHAVGCTTPVPPRLLMCPRHWRMVPQALQVAVWANYSNGQEIRKNPTAEYIQAANNAIEAVAALESQARRQGQLDV